MPSLQEETPRQRISPSPQPPPALQPPRFNPRALPPPVSLAAGLALPSLSQSTLADMGYWVDWAALLGMAAGVGVAAAVLLWPVLAMRQR